MARTSFHIRRAGVLMLSVLALSFGLALSTGAEAQTAGKGAKSTQTAKQKAAKSRQATARKSSARAPRQGRKAAVRAAPPRPSAGQIAGLRQTDDALDLKSSVALVVDQETNEVLFSKNPEAVLPIASITKLMTALVVTEAGLPLDEKLVVSREDVEATAGSRSRLMVGTELTRGEMLHLALMASENRAAHVLGRTFPGGTDRFVSEMNAKARALGMSDTRYVEPTGLSASNQSSAKDLTRLVKAASLHPIIRELSTSLEAVIDVGRRAVAFHNTNGLVRHPEWEIGLQKTGYIAAAGRCVVMQTQMAGRKLIMVLLDSAGKYTRIGDAERLRKWLSDSPLMGASTASPQPATVQPAVQSVPAAAVQSVVPAAVVAAPATAGPAVSGPWVRPIALPGVEALAPAAAPQPR